MFGREIDQVREYGPRPPRADRRGAAPETALETGSGVSIVDVALLTGSDGPRLTHYDR